MRRRQRRNRTVTLQTSEYKSGATSWLTSARESGTTSNCATSWSEDYPALTVTEDPAEIRSAIHALATKVRVARVEAKQGDLFTPAISLEFRKVLIVEMNPDTWAAIMDDNPGEFSNQINGTYPEDKPLSTVPPNILAVLPRLPDDIQYRLWDVTLSCSIRERT